MTKAENIRNQCIKILDKYNLTVMKNNTDEVGCFSIWINEYTKNGYHRKATIDKVKDGDILLT